MNINEITNTNDILLYNETKSSPVKKAAMAMAELDPEQSLELIKTALEALKVYHIYKWQNEDVNDIWMLDAMKIQMAQDTLDQIEL